MNWISIPHGVMHARSDVSSRRTGRRGTRWTPSLVLEGLEPRLVLSAPAAAVPVQMLSATQTDSKSITIDYQVNQPPAPGQPLQFGIYRSSDSQFDSNATLVDNWTVAAPGPGDVPLDLSPPNLDAWTVSAPGPGQAGALVDDAGQPAADLGTHQLTIPLPDGLPIDPQEPNVLVVADPDLPSAATDPAQTASIRTYSIGIVTHGGLQNTHWKFGPAWQVETAVIMKQQGYDAVIPYNWLAASDLPGRAAMQGPRLASEILAAASQFPAGDPVDLHFIGHSEGAVVNTQAMVALESQMTPELKAGYIQDTLLDPHPANNSIPGQEYSVTSGPLGMLATAEISSFQSQAKDPPVFIPPIVTEADVFYEHTTAANSHGVNDDLYNLWGEVPVKGPAHYYNLTAAGATHAGITGVNQWYADFVAPTLGDQAPLIQTLQLDGQIDGVPGVNPTGLAPGFSGTAAPDSTIRLYVGPASNPSKIGPAGWTKANASGQWSLTINRALPNGDHRAVATAFSRALATRPALAIIPTLPLGEFVTYANPSGRSTVD
jgi:hypothetical protein